jgi:hypothetical protein
MTEDGHWGLVPNWRSSSLAGAFPPIELLPPALVPIKFRNDYSSDVSMGNSASDDNNNFFAAPYRFLRLWHTSSIVTCPLAIRLSSTSPAMSALRVV